MTDLDTALRAADEKLPEAARLIRDHLEALLERIATLRYAADRGNLRAGEAERERDALREALDIFVRCAYPVSKEIDPRGHVWCMGWLDQALSSARVALKKERK